MPDVVPEVAGFHDPLTGSIQYIVSDPASRHCAIIDPVLDFDPKSGSTRTASADRLLAHIDAHGLIPAWILDTHPHADHFSAAAYLRGRLDVPMAIGERIVGVQELWRDIYGLPDSFPADGSQWDRLLADGDTISLGNTHISVMLCPGHTLCSVTYAIGDAAFIHDTLFMPDSGTARADFPGGDACALWHSIQRILALPATTRLFTGHDYRPSGRPAAWQSSVAEQKAANPHLRDQDEAGYIALRTGRDRTLPMPGLILAALQVNIAGGRLPEPDASGRRCLRIPLDAFPHYPWA